MAGLAGRFLPHRARGTTTSPARCSLQLYKYKTMLRVAVGAAAGLLVAGLLQRGGGHKPRPQQHNRERRHVPRTSSARQQRRSDRGSGAAAAEAAAPAPGRRCRALEQAALLGFAAC